jgi:hypothetical protein
LLEEDRFAGMSPLIRQQEDSIGAEELPNRVYQGTDAFQIRQRDDIRGDNYIKAVATICSLRSADIVRIRPEELGDLYPILKRIF